MTSIVRRAVNRSAFAPSFKALGSEVRTPVAGSLGREDGIGAPSGAAAGFRPTLARRNDVGCAGVTMGSAASRAESISVDALSDASSVKSDLQKCWLLFACEKIRSMTGLVGGARRPCRSLTRLDSLLEKLESPNFLFAAGGKPDFGSR